MKSDTPLDYAIFQLSPRRSRDGNTEKLASGLVKPFVAHLKAAEEQVASAAQSIKLELEKHNYAETWFSKGTLERFVRFVSTPEVLELVNTLDAEMSQLEAACKIYSEGGGDQLSGGGGSSTTAAADATKKELLRAIDVRLAAVKQDLTTACSRAAAAGFNLDSVLELQTFADRFGAHRLNEACGKFISLSERRPDLISPWSSRSDDRAIRSSCGSDMSIDDELTSPPPGPDHHQKRNLDQHKTSINQQTKPPSLAFPLHRTFSRESSFEQDDANKQNEATVEKNSKGEESSTTDQAESVSATQPGRRLSVQDRIKMFENNQKESSGSGGKPVVGKSVELRRLSSDVSVAPTGVEKAVLRRWSGASDMSIDLSAEKKDTESPLCTPSSASVSNIKTEDQKTMSDAATGSYEARTKFVVETGLGRDGDSGSRDAFFNKPADGSESGKSNPKLGMVESDGWKDQTREKTPSRSSFGRVGQHSLKGQERSESQLGLFPASKNEGIIGSGDDGKLKSVEEAGATKGRVASETQFSGTKDQGTQKMHFAGFKTKVGDNRSTSTSNQPVRAESLNRKEDFGWRGQSIPESHLRAPQKTVVEPEHSEGGAGSKIREAFSAQYKGTEGDSFSLEPKGRSMRGMEEFETIESTSSERTSGRSSSRLEDSGPHKFKFQRQSAAPEYVKKVPIQRDESSSFGNRTPFAKSTAETRESCDPFSTPTVEQVQRVKQSKGNQELNDELKMKANELEKLFAEHKLRIPGDQSNSARRGRLAETQSESTATLPYTKPVADMIPQYSDSYSPTDPVGSSRSVAKFHANPPVKTPDNQNFGDALNKNFTELSISEGSRGKFYSWYMQKRDAKLREEWGSNRAEKEAKLKAMQDTFEQSRAEMKAKLSGSADRKDSVTNARRRADRVRSFNTRSIMKREQQRLDFGDSEDEDDASEVVVPKLIREDRILDEASFEDGISKSMGKKLLPSKSLSSSTPRTSGIPVPRSATKASSISSGRRRMQSDNPLAQSVPIFSEMRKENTKPSSAVSKTSRPQLRNYTRSKSTSEEVSLVKEDKSRRSQSLRKSAANLSEFGEMSPLDTEGVILTPLKFDEEIVKNVESKPFLKKGSRTNFVGRASITKQKSSKTSEPANNEEENDDLPSGSEDLVDAAKDYEEGENETMTSDGNKNYDNGEPRLSVESEASVKSGSQNGSSFPQVEQALDSGLPTVAPSSFPVESIQEWSAESPVSWNSRTQHPFSYPNETSDVDVSVDSPVGSPASWNSHSLSQFENDAARMRKKWGAAQRPMLVAHSSNNSSRKDMTRGFKRLLKFGRKSRGSDLVDWISATTSEGDDDTEDGRDPAHRSSEDLRKSRMGFSQGQPSDDSFNESEFFSEHDQPSHSSIPAPPANFRLREDHMSGSSIKAPRSSFFSSSLFRSKGSDSKPR